MCNKLFCSFFFVVLIATQLHAATIAPGDFAGAFNALQQQVQANQKAVERLQASQPATLPLLPQETSAAQAGPTMFGSQLFTGAFAAGQGGKGFNPDYRIAPGDQVSLKTWGAVTQEGVVTVDPQGSLFVPGVGPLRVEGVPAGELNKVMESHIRTVFRSNVGVYASLETSQPVKVFVTGFVRRPGLYNGLPSDSLITYMDRAGGVDPDRGSWRDVQVLRNGKPYKSFDLYTVMLKGGLEPIQLHDGDSIHVGPRKSTATASGDVLNANIFEFSGESLSLVDFLAMAQPKAGVTNISIVRRQGAERRSDYLHVRDAAQYQVQNGDEVLVLTDRAVATILVRVSGAHSGDHALILPYGAKLSDVMSRVKPNVRSNLSAVQIYRKSVADRQKERLLVALQQIEQAALTAKSSTNEESQLRSKEAEMVSRFVEKAKAIQPKGQIVLQDDALRGETLIEDGDVVVIPEKTSLVLTHGEVMFPSALGYRSGWGAEDYIKRSGGYTVAADQERLVVIRQSGEVFADGEVKLQAGDEVFVLPVVKSKYVEIARGISQILYHIAIAAKVAVGI